MAPYVIYVAADLYNHKVNLELTFPSFPTMSELQQHVQTVFTAECLSVRPAGAKQQVFGISRIQLYNDATGDWRDLTSSASLQPFAQLYVFQSDPNYRESQEQIAPARKPACYSSPVRHRQLSPPRDGTPFGFATTPANAQTRVPFNTPIGANGATPAGISALHASRTAGLSSTPSGRTPHAVAATPKSAAVQVASTLFSVAASHTDKVHIIFESAAKSGSSYIQESDFRSLLRDTNIDFAPYVTSAIFRYADSDRDGSVSFNDLLVLLKEYPTLTDALFFRLKDLQEAELLQQRLAEETVQVEDAKRRRLESEAHAEEALRRLEGHQSKLRDLDDEWQRRLEAENEVSDKLTKEHNNHASLSDTSSFQHKELALSVNQEENVRRALADAERDARYCEQQVAKSHERREAANDKVRELAEMLEAARLEANHQQSNVVECEEELRRARDRERHCADNLTTSNEELNNRKSASDKLTREVAAAASRLAELEGILHDCHRENERLAEVIEGTHADTRKIEHAIEDARKDVIGADAAIAEAMRQLKSADQAVINFAKRRAATEAKERPLLEQEIRLKEQRLQLDESEALLRRETYTVFDPTVRANSYSRSQ